MAKETHQKDTEKAFIDYEEEAVDNEPARNWRSIDLQNHWRKLLVKYHSAGGYLWSLKDVSKLKRLRDEFSPETVSEMMEWWIKEKDTDSAFDFGKFYWYRFEVHNKMREQKEGWKWS